MLKSKKPVKVSHKEIKEDQLVTAYTEVLAYYYKFQKQILIAGVAFLVIVAGTAAYLFLKSSNEKEAADLLSKVYPFVESNQIDLALNGETKTGVIGLKAIADDFGSTPSGTVAELYTAKFSYDLKNYDEAEKYYDAISSDDPTLQSAAYSGLAAVKEQKKDFEAAAGLYIKAADQADNKALSPRFLHLAALNYAEAGNFKNAVSTLTDLKEKYKDSSYGKEADKFIALFSAKIAE
ncbi:MAG: tetratricopeptide repeat protein [Bacteroidetes bacterium]|nr:tetratricopeptide repeat protein [Bacteroidota bacterium]